ncbi:hypothetical protein E5288_WYG009936 [Bos mutus]|uniref:Uncharacterized protein n=1 Tax=Bos mutus TaxID=72004 RepID=A0A6B0S4H3_9CETA|nr:hypothetical protein [Bos mutus]
MLKGSRRDMASSTGLSVKRLTAPEVSKVRASPLEHDREAQLLRQAPIRGKASRKLFPSSPAPLPDCSRL